MSYPANIIGIVNDMEGFRPGTVQVVMSSRRVGKSFAMAREMNKKSTRLWVGMLKAGHFDRRKMKRMWRLIEEGK